MSESNKREVSPEDQARYDREWEETISSDPKPKTIDTEIDDLLARAGVTRDRIEGPDIELLPVTGSSQIAKAGYNPATRLAQVEFVSGGTYEYEDLDPSIWEAFRQTFDDENASPGKFFNQHLRGLKYRKVSTDDPHPFDELANEKSVAEPLPVITPDIQMIEQSMAEASVNSAGAAASVSKTLVPEFGHILETRNSTALAFGFPPAVDTLIAKAKLSPEQNEHLLAQFKNMFVLSAQMRARVQTIEVRGPEDTAAIAEAKECWQITRDERLNAEKRKKIVKDPYLRPSQLIDGVYRIWIDEIGPIEKEAKYKAEFAENLERERKAALAKERLDKLKLFGADGGAIDLGDIDDALFETIYQGAIAQYKARKAEEERVERERLEREQAAEAERVRLAAENERLMREQAAAAARNAELQQQADAERQKKEALEREAARQREERLAEERRLAAIAEAKRIAPDKEKLNAYFEAIQKTASDEMPKDFVSDQAKMISEAFFSDLGDLVNRYSRQAESLVKIN